MLSNEFSFQAGSQSGPSLEIELIGPGTRIRGNVNLGSYVRLSDLLNFHDQLLQLSGATVLDPTGKEMTSRVPVLDVRLVQISLVVDHSGYVPPVPTEELGIPKVSHRLLAVTEAQLITGTFFTHPSAEPGPYLLAFEPKWIPIADLEVRSLLVPSVVFEAAFAVLNRAGVSATTVREEAGAPSEANPSDDGV